MNGHRVALQRCAVAGAAVGLLLGMGAVGPSYAQAGLVRAHAALNGAGTARAAIVDGGPASIAEFPFQVALYDPRLGPPAKSFFCGGVILDANRVATAAHCLVGERGRRSVPDEIAVLAGSSQLAPIEPGGVQDPVASDTVDPSYNPSSSDYDVGLLQLARPLWSGPTPPLDGHSTIAPLTPGPALAGIGSASGPAAPTQALVSGWGDLNPEPGPPPVYPLRLRRARVPLVSDGFCEEAYAAIEQTITPRMLCAGGAPAAGEGRTDSCYGDSGGPLVADPAGAPAPAGDVLIGLVDFGNGCAQAGYPGVYVRVANPAIASFLHVASATAAGGVRRGLCARSRTDAHAHRRHGRHSRRAAHGKRRCRA